MIRERENDNKYYSGSILLLRGNDRVLAMNRNVNSSKYVKIHSHTECGTISIIISAVVIVVAALNLLLDFDSIENGARSGVAKHMEWYSAIGLMMTLVWLYLEILRFVSYFMKNEE